MEKKEKKAEEKKVVDFTGVEIENIDGSKEKVCLVEEGKDVVVGIIVKQFANTVYSQSKDIGEVELARTIYKTGKAEMDKSQASALKKYAENFPYVLRTAIESAFDVFD